jgi:hypothetical protein
MKNWFLLSLICLFVLFAFGSSFAQNVTPRTPPTREDNKDREKICPTISVSCPSDPKLSEPLDFKATVSGGDPNVTPTYSWEVANGEIIEGQGTPAIKVRAFGPQTVTATLRVDGFDSACARTASCSTPIHLPPPPPEKIDSYGLILFDQVRARLDQFAAALKEHPGAMGYIFGYGGRQRSAGEARTAIDSAKQYLLEKFDIEKDRIGKADGGSREEFTIELWLVPPGAALPAAAPTVDKDKNSNGKTPDTPLKPTTQT